MDSSLIANMDNVIARNEFLATQRQKLNDYYEPDSPLNKAQSMSDTLRVRQQRKPMVLEYYKEKGVIDSIEMYINPDNMQFSAAKVNNKVYTRGGTFFHHWGDDNPILQISGTVGLSMMKGIEQLEKVYYNSGTLLRYKDVGVDVVNNGIQYDYEVIDFNSPYGCLEYITSNNLDKGRINEIVQDSNKYAQYNYDNNKYCSSDLKQCEISNYLINNYSASADLNKDSVKINELYIALMNFKSNKEDSIGYCNFNMLFQEAKMLCKKSFSNYDENIINDLAFNYATSFSDIKLETNTMSSYRDITNGKLERMSAQLTDVQKFNEDYKIGMDDIAPGIEDINEELNDEWRPRMVFLYFEDRVYIGHFDNFNWARNAQSPLINYNMRFTISRQLLMTSTIKNPYKPSTTYPIIKPEVDSSYEPLDPSAFSDVVNKKLEKIREEAKQNKITYAVESILQLKGEWRYKDDLNRTQKGTGLSTSQTESYRQVVNAMIEATRINGVTLIVLPNKLLDNVMYDAMAYLDYMEYCLSKQYTWIKPLINSECKRIRTVVEKEYKTWDKPRKDQVEKWIREIFVAINARQNYYSDLDYVIKLLKIKI